MCVDSANIIKERIFYETFDFPVIRCSFLVLLLFIQLFTLYLVHGRCMQGVYKVRFQCRHSINKKLSNAILVIRVYSYCTVNPHNNIV